MSVKLAPFAWNHCPTCGDALTPDNDGQEVRPHCRRCNRFYYSNPIPAACCFVTRGDELLMVQRSVEPCKGEWSLPGGFIELGETSEEAVLRELEEETGLRGERPVLLGVSVRQSPHSGAILVVGYLIEEWEGDLLAATDAMAAEFFVKADRPPLAFEVHRDLIALFDARDGR
jgi:8-oxo-dGTP diphosphatase